MFSSNIMSRIFFFPFKFFLQQHKTIINSNNMKNNYMNQLLTLPLLKYHTHTQTHTKYIYTYNKEKKIIIIKRRQYDPPSPRKKKGLLQHPKRRSSRQQLRNRSRQLLPQRPSPQRS